MNADTMKELRGRTTLPFDRRKIQMGFLYIKKISEWKKWADLYIGRGLQYKTVKDGLTTSKYKGIRREGSGLLLGM